MLRCGDFGRRIGSDQNPGSRLVSAWETELAGRAYHRHGTPTPVLAQRSVNTQPELALRRALRSLGFR
ncbi:hypothetical protein ABH930_004146 [Kitasatospora sp. GAS204A]|nr:hypothetical protein [Kitasatospora sp. GAS204B]